MPTEVSPPALNLCIVSMFYYHDRSCAGPSSYYFNLTQSLSHLGHRVFLVVPESSVPPNPDPSFQICTIRNRQLLAGDGVKPGFMGLARVLNRLLFSYQALRKVRELDRSVNLDAILAHELFAPGLLIGFFMGKKLITRIHSPSYIGDKYNERYSWRWMRYLPSIPERIQVKRSRGLSVASTHLAAVLARDWRIEPGRIRVIPNSVQVDWVCELAETQRREIAGRYILYFGRIERGKGVHILSRSLSRVLSAKPDLTMVFVGRDCGLSEGIRRENRPFQNRVLFFDTMAKQRLFGIVRFAELVVLPSLFENFSLAGLEAMALARPVIGTYRTAFEEIIQDGSNGFLVEPGDPEGLARKILSCLDREDLDLIGSNAYQTALRFDSNAVAAQKVAFYRNILAGPL